MTKIALFGSAAIGIALLCSVARAQDYGGSYDAPAYDRPQYDRAYDGPPPETVIVRPYYGGVEKRQLAGRINGEVDPTEYRLSTSVSFSDLDLSRRGDRLELRNRIHDAASQMCAELDARVPQLRGYPSEDRECVRTATNNAMRDVFG
jgi:UrcA family protein